MKWTVLLAIVACTRAEHRAAREKYDEGVADLKKGDFAAAEKALIDARDEAGVDPELRFRAAYDLGVAYAAHADKTKAGEDADLDKALELEQQAVSWFFDAQRLRKNDPDVKANLAIARARVLKITDELAKGERKLEARLDALIQEQRGVVDEARAAWLAISQAHGADPLAQQGPLVRLADRERGVLAESGVIEDLAADEIDSIGKKPEDKRTDEEKGRLIELKNLDLYIEDARARIAEARKKLQELAAQDGTARGEAALGALKRAREQLLDPVTVLRELAQDQLQLASEAHAPQATSLGDRENGLRDRTDEIGARLATSDKKEVAAARPHVTAASLAMEHARVAFAAGKVDEAEKPETEAVTELAKAIEQFANLKQTIDIAAETQHQVVDQLAKKSKDAIDGLDANVARVARIKELLAAEEKPKDPKQEDEWKQRQAAAESLRSDAEKALAEAEAAVKANKDPQPAAKRAADKLDELRRLYFSVIEHLQDLIRRQGETKDQTSQANADDDFTRAPKLPGIVQRETEHQQMAKAITDALAKQADTEKDKAKDLAAAADEVRLAGNDMADASTTLGKAQQAQQSVTLQPALDSEGKAIEHLENALKLLQPPPKKKQDQKKQDQKQDQQQQQQPQGGAGQRARDEDAKRQKQKAQNSSEPVDQDW